VVLSVLAPVGYWDNLPTICGYTLVVLLTCLTTSVTALFCSVVVQKTSTSLMLTYLVILVLFGAPLAAAFFASTFFPTSEAMRWVSASGVTSPFVALFNLPLDVDMPGVDPRRGNLPLVIWFCVFALAYNAALLVTMSWLFKTRWRVAD
jgi:hypothetical protein